MSPEGTTDVSTNGKPLRVHDDPMNEPLPSLRDSMWGWTTHPRTGVRGYRLPSLRDSTWIGLMLIPGLASGATACRPFETWIIRRGPPFGIQSRPRFRHPIDRGFAAKNSREKTDCRRTFRFYDLYALSRFLNLGPPEFIISLCRQCPSFDNSPSTSFAE